MKHVVITGSTRGIGFGLAESFLDLGCAIAISGRTEERTQEAVEKLVKRFGRERVFGFACDVGQPNQVEALWEACRQVFSKIDIWVNNAGISSPLAKFWDQPEPMLDALISTNLMGTLYGARTALRGMSVQGYGAVYTMLGFGSDGRKQDGMALYGTSKAALRYFTEALAFEVKGTPLLVGSISPGMVVTDLITMSRYTRPDSWERVKRVLNLLGDRVETVTPWLAKRILANKKNGAQIRWLTTGKLLWRMVSSPVRRRNVVK